VFGLLIDDDTNKFDLPAAGAPYLALYRRWRPQLFSQILGQEHITRSLQNALGSGRIAHAYLFSGLRGTGKTTMAKLLGKALNCLEGVKAEPCNRCRSCVEVTAGRNLDVMEIDAASNRGIDEIRDLREKVRYAPAQNRYKVYIIDEVHMLTGEAFNALLKILEEPPPLVVFILATTEVYKIPLTIISRCQRYDFHLLEAGQLVERLREVAAVMQFSVDEETLLLLARQAEGAARDALGLLEQCRAYGGEAISYGQALEILGLPAPEILHRYYQAVIDEDLAAGLALIREVVWRGMDLQRLLKEKILYLRKLLLLQAGGDTAATLADVPPFRPYLLEHCAKFDSAVILEMLEILQETNFQLRGASQPQFLLELAFLRLARVYRFRAYLAPAALLQRLESLEQKLLAAGQGRLAPNERSAPAAGDDPDRCEPGGCGQPPLQPSRRAGTETRPYNRPAAEQHIPSDAGLPAPAPDPAGPQTLPPDAVSPPTASDHCTLELGPFWENSFMASLRKERKHNLLAYLLEAVPFSWKGGIFAVAVPTNKAYLKKRLEAPLNRSYLEKLLRELLGAPAALQIIIGGPAKEAEVSGKKAAQPPQADNTLAASAPFLGSNAAFPAPGRARDDLPPSGAGRIPSAASADYFIRQALEIFEGRLIEGGREEATRGKPQFPVSDLWSDGEPVPPLPEDFAEELAEEDD
jgi:DNA polymerase-3 subunit gamma/tau